MNLGLIMLTLSFSHVLFAQEPGLTTIKVVSAPNNELITPAVQNLLENKMLSVLMANNITEGYATKFILVPQFSANEKTIVEGMQKMTVVKFDMHLQVTNWSSNDVLASQSMIITGSGSDDSEALKNAVSKIKPNDVRFKDFLKKASEKILQYYQSECSNLMMQTDKHAATHNYASALSILAGIPQEVSCYSEAVKKAEVFYQKHQQQTCNNNMQQAKAYATSNNYKSALYYLGQIDRQTSCIKEADALMTQIGENMDGQNKKEWELIMKRQEVNTEVEKVKADILNKILESHYREKVVVIGN